MIPLKLVFIITYIISTPRRPGKACVIIQFNAYPAGRRRFRFSLPKNRRRVYTSSFSLARNRYIVLVIPFLCSKQIPQRNRRIILLTNSPLFWKFILIQKPRNRLQSASGIEDDGSEPHCIEREHSAIFELG